MSRAMKCLLLVTSSAVLSVCPAQLGFGASRPVVLNEIMASNSTAVKDPQGQYDDWIELYNNSSAAVDAAGLYLTDDRDVPTKWQVPTGNKSLTTIPARGFLVIWADGETQDTGLHASFNLGGEGDAVYLFEADGRTLLDSLQFSRQVTNISYGRYPNGTGKWQFLTVATPGTANASAYPGVVSDPAFNYDHGFHDAPFDLALSCGTPGATIYYSTDGSMPYQKGTRGVIGTVYTQPLRITKTTCVRAVAVKPGWVSSRQVAQTYIFLNDVLQQPAHPSGFPTSWKGVNADYEMAPYILSHPQYGPQIKSALLSLPTMSLILDQHDLFDAATGIYANPGNSGVTWERPGSVELIFPDDTPGFQVNCGVRMQGGAFRSTSMTTKHSFRLLFKSAYGPSKLRYPLFGEDATGEFETIILRAGANDGYAWSGNEQNATYVRDQFIHDLQRATGHASGHGRFVHLYVNGLYWGLYNPCERPDGAFSSAYYGGQKEDWDEFKHKSFDLIQGDRTALTLMLAQCQTAAISYDALQKLQGLNPNGTLNPTYPCLLDLADYVDYLIVNYWAGNWDWPWNNYWLGRDRTAASTGFKFYCWDAEDVMLTSRSVMNWNCLTDSRAGTDVGQPQALLKNNAEYRLFFADRVHRLFFNAGVLTPEALIPRYTQLAATVEKAIICEAARWGDMHGRQITPQSWTTMRDTTLKTYLPQRTALVLGQLRAAGLYPIVEAPVFYVNGTYQHGGHITTSDSLSMKSTSGTIYYTLNGTDPRVPGKTGQAAISPTAGQYLRSITLAKSTVVKTRVLSGTAWSALNEATFAVGPVAQSLRVSELMYHPQDAGNPNDPNTEFIELTNTASQSINLTLVRFTRGIDYTFPSYDLAPGGYCLVVKDLAAFQAKYGAKLPVVGQYAGSFSNAGERVEVVDAADTVIQSFEYRDDWYKNTDGLGYSLTVKNPKAANADSLNDASVWQPALPSPGRASP